MQLGLFPGPSMHERVKASRLPTNTNAISQPGFVSVHPAWSPLSRSGPLRIARMQLPSVHHRQTCQAIQDRRPLARLPILPASFPFSVYPIGARRLPPKA